MQFGWLRQGLPGWLGMPGRSLLTGMAGMGVVPRGGRALALATLCTLLFLTFLNNTVVSVALGACRSACTQA